MASKTKLYPHRHNQDGSYDSICPACFATIGGCNAGGQLAESDRAHVCDSAFLAERGIFTQSDLASQSAPARPGPTISVNRVAAVGLATA